MKPEELTEGFLDGRPIQCIDDELVDLSIGQEASAHKVSIHATPEQSLGLPLQCRGIPSRQGNRCRHIKSSLGRRAHQLRTAQQFRITGDRIRRQFELRGRIVQQLVQPHCIKMRPPTQIIGR